MRKSTLTSLSLNQTIGYFAGLGFSMASLFPTTLVWAQRRMTITGRVAGYFFMGAGAGGMVLPWVIGQLFESLSPYVTMWIILVDVVAAFAVYFVLMAYSSSLKRQSSAV